MTNEWFENTGEVPEGVGPDTAIEVEYRDGVVLTWPSWSDPANDRPYLWDIENKSNDIIRWRFV